MHIYGISRRMLSFVCEYSIMFLCSGLFIHQYLAQDPMIRRQNFVSHSNIKITWIICYLVGRHLGLCHKIDQKHWSKPHDTSRDTRLSRVRMARGVTRMGQQPNARRGYQWCILETRYIPSIRHHEHPRSPPA